jgi:3-hydroxyacyl-[acyl-carrier-protein] dehydratase
MSDYQHILDQLPHAPPFRFIDEILNITEQHIRTRYTFKPDEFFYQGHYPGRPVTPGAIVCEAMVQGGLAAFVIYLASLHGRRLEPNEVPILTSWQADFLKPVIPGETLIVESEKIYYRFQKLKCRIKALNEAGETVCEGIFSGMIFSSANLQQWTYK